MEAALRNTTVPSSPARRGLLHMKRILIVEANIEQCLALSDFLNGLGFETGVADTGLRALHMLAKYRPLPDFILLDVKLSSSNNWGLRDVLKKHDIYKNIPVILMGDHDVGQEVEIKDAAAELDFKIPMVINGLLDYCKQ